MWYVLFDVSKNGTDDGAGQVKLASVACEIGKMIYWEQGGRMVRVKSSLVVMVVGILALVVGACMPAGSPSPNQTPHGDEKAVASNSPAEPVLSGALTRGCTPTTRPGGGFATIGLSEGEKAVNFKLEDVHGNEFVLSRLLAEKPVVMVFGSFT